MISKEIKRQIGKKDLSRLILVCSSEQFLNSMIIFLNRLGNSTHPHTHYQPFILCKQFSQTFAVIERSINRKKLIAIRCTEIYS